MTSTWILVRTLHDHLKRKQRAFGAAAYCCHTECSISQPPKDVSEPETQCFVDKVLKDIFQAFHGWQTFVKVLGGTCRNLGLSDFRNLRFSGGIYRNIRRLSVGLLRLFGLGCLPNLSLAGLGCLVGSLRHAVGLGKVEHLGVVLANAQKNNIISFRAPTEKGFVDRDSASCIFRVEEAKSLLLGQVSENFKINGFIHLEYSRRRVQKKLFSLVLVFHGICDHV